MKKHIEQSFYALSNYAAENRAVALGSNFEGKPLGQWLVTKQESTDQERALAVNDFITEHCQHPTLTSLQLSLYSQEDPEKLLKELLSDLGPEGSSDRERKLETLLILGKGLPELEGDQPKITQLERAFNDLGPDKLSVQILAGLQCPEKPVAALALYLGAEKPWVRRRTEQLQDLDTWNDLVAANFNTSPKVLLEGAERFAVMAEHSNAGRYYELAWARPDFQAMVGEQMGKLGNLPNKDAVSGGEGLEVESGALHACGIAPETLTGLTHFMDCQPGHKEKEKINNVASLCAMLEEALSSRRPDGNIVEYYQLRGCSPDQANLRAAYMGYAKNSFTQSPNAAARRLATSLQAPRSISPDVTVSPESAWWQKLKGFTSRCVQAFQGGNVNPVAVAAQLEDGLPPQQGYQSWQHKDELVEQIEATLERNVNREITKDPWVVLLGVGVKDRDLDTPVNDSEEVEIGM